MTASRGPGDEETVAGEVDHRRAVDQRVGQVAHAKREIGAAVGQETALAARFDQRDQSAGLAARVADKMRRDAGALEPRCFAPLVGGADAGDEIDRGAEMGEPCRLIGRRSARPIDDRGAPVGAARDRPFGLDDRVDHQVADDENARRGGRRPALGHRRVSSTATCAARIALFSTSAILASRLRPPVSSTMRPSRNGVTSFLAMPWAFASATASAMRASIAWASRALSSGIGLAISSPPGPISRCSLTMRARSCRPSQRWSSLKPLERA